MKHKHQSGHALSTTLIVMILLTILSLSVAKNSLIDIKITHAFNHKLLQEERHLSALRYLELIVLPNLIAPQPMQFEQFNNLNYEEPLHMTIPIDTALNVRQTNSNQMSGESDRYLNPQASITLLRHTSDTISVIGSPKKLRVEIVDPNTGQNIIAIYQYAEISEAGTETSQTLRRLSFRRVLLRSDTHV